MKRPYFSAVINNYNYGRFVGQAIESVEAQDFPKSEVEIVVVDDGSTDDSRDVLAKFGDRIRLICQKNAGQASAMTTGLQAAKGEVCCLFDADDLWHPKKLSRVAEALRDKEVGLVQHFQREMDLQGRELPHALPPWPPYYTLESIVSGRLDYGATSSIALRKTIVDKIMPIPNDLWVTTDVYLVDFGLLHAKIANIPEVLGWHRLHGGNNWAKMYESPKKLKGTLIEAERYRKHLEPRLRERGLPWKHQHYAFQPGELARREVLLASHEGRRLDVLRLMPKLFRASGGGAFGLFRCATCLLAFVSPWLYLKFHAFYDQSGWPAKLREKLLPKL